MQDDKNLSVSSGVEVEEPSGFFRVPSWVLVLLEFLRALDSLEAAEDDEIELLKAFHALRLVERMSFLKSFFPSAYSAHALRELDRMARRCLALMVTLVRLMSLFHHDDGTGLLIVIIGHAAECALVRCKLSASAAASS